jgi:rubrerythrin
MKTINHNESHLVKAKSAYNQIIKIWDAKVTHVYTNLINITKKHEKEFEEKLYKKIQTITYADLTNESEKRESLMEIIALCKAILHKT